MAYSINTEWAAHNAKGTIIHGYDLSDVVPQHLDVIKRVIEARRYLEAKSRETYRLNTRAIFETVHREQDRFALHPEHVARRRKNMKKALFQGCLRLYGQRYDLTPGVDRSNAMGHYPHGIKADYMFGTPFFDSVLEDKSVNTNGPRALFLEEGVEVRVWKTQPPESWESGHDQRNPPPHLRNTYMWANFKIGEGGYDVIAIPYDVLTESARFSAAYLSKAVDENPVFRWLSRDVRAVNQAYRALESEARAIAEMQERDQFLSLLKKFGPSLANGTWRPDLTTVKEPTYYEFQGYSEWELEPKKEN